MAKPEAFLSAPIPGQSLTATPKNYAWERPPQMSSYEEATKYYINKLADQEAMDDLAVAFDAGMSISAFVEALTTTGVSEGLHSIDVSLIISPVLHAFLKAAMLEYGIEAKDDVYNPEKDTTAREKRRLETAIKVALAEAQADDRTAESDPGVAILQQVSQNLNAEPEVDNTEVEEAMPQQEEPSVETRRGLMARGGM